MTLPELDGLEPRPPTESMLLNPALKLKVGVERWVAAVEQNAGTWNDSLDGSLELLSQSLESSGLGQTSFAVACIETAHSVTFDLGGSSTQKNTVSLSYAFRESMKYKQASLIFLAALKLQISQADMSTPATT